MRNFNMLEKKKLLIGNTFIINAIMTSKCFREQGNISVEVSKFAEYFFFLSWLLKEVGQLINRAAAPSGHSKCDRCICQQEDTPK